MHLRERASIKDVAALAGVSFKTVSRVVNGVDTVLPELRARVEAAVAKLDYVPNSAARSLKSGSGNAIGIVVDSIDDVFFASLVRAVEDRALELGLAVMVGSTGIDAQRERDQLTRLAGHTFGASFSRRSAITAILWCRDARFTGGDDRPVGVGVRLGHR